MRTQEEQQAAIQKAAEWVRLNVFGIQPHAKGGLFSRPHVGLVAEAGPEAIIPLNGSSGAKSLWQTTGEKLGMNTGGGSGGGIVIHATFAPVIHGAGAEIIPTLEQQQKSFHEMLKEELQQQKRLSFYN
jgi:hypothetical protein